MRREELIEFAVFEPYFLIERAELAQLATRANTPASRSVNAKPPQPTRSQPERFLDDSYAFHQ
jgi:hypothetical protein